MAAIESKSFFEKSANVENSFIEVVGQSMAMLLKILDVLIQNLSSNYAGNNHRSAVAG